MRRALLVAALTLTVVACGGHKQTATTNAGVCAPATPRAAGGRHEAKPGVTLDASKTYDVTLQTNCGSFTIRLAVKTSPATTASFVSLVQKKYFDGTVFHRIVPGFVIQGGDPTGTGGGGPGYKTVDKPPASTRYTHGVVAMAKTQAEAPGTSGSQFFVVTARDAGLPPDYAVLGKVVQGLDVVDRIGKLGDVNERPTELVQIEHAAVTIHR